MKNEQESALMESWQALKKSIDGRCFAITQGCHRGYLALHVIGREADIDRLLGEHKHEPEIGAQVLSQNAILLWVVGLTPEILGEGCTEEPWAKEDEGGVPDGYG